jgi:hypothetical protein
MFCFRRLIPAILALAAIVDVGLRVLPPDRLALRAWEAVTLFVTGPGPFALNKHYVNRAAIGDLATLANLPAEAHPHGETFTTGPEGFRTYAVGRDRPPAALMIGDSFGAGAALDDADALATRLGPVVGGPVVFASFYYSGVQAVSVLHAPLVIMQLSERNVLPPAFPEGDPDGRSLLRTAVPAGSQLDAVLRYVRDMPKYSPLSIWSGRAYKALQNGRVLPNPYETNVVKFRLVDGDTMMFLRSELEHRLAPPPVRINTVLGLKARVEQQASKFVVLLVPDKLTVYGPLQADGATVEPGNLYIDAQERALRSAGVRVINLKAALQREARSALARQQYLYHLDDTHWNESGVLVAVQEIQRQFDGIDSGEMIRR